MSRPCYSPGTIYSSLFLYRFCLKSSWTSFIMQDTVFFIHIRCSIDTCIRNTIDTCIRKSFIRTITAYWMYCSQFLFLQYWQRLLYNKYIPSNLLYFLHLWCTKGLQRSAVILENRSNPVLFTNVFGCRVHYISICMQSTTTSIIH